jgi:hypothetical protein
MKNLIKLALVICLCSTSYTIRAGSCTPTNSAYGVCSVSGNDYASETYAITYPTILTIMMRATIQYSGSPYMNVVYFTASWSTNATTPPLWSSTPGWWNVSVSNSDGSTTFTSGGDEAAVGFHDTEAIAGPITLTAASENYDQGPYYGGTTVGTLIAQW